MDKNLQSSGETPHLLFFDPDEPISKESFDHIVRSQEQLAKIRRYIRENPRGETPRLH